MLSGGAATAEQCLAAARKFYAGRPFVRVVEQPPHTKWATGSNLVFVSYASPGAGTIIALGGIDNLGKGAAGQAVQNANLMCGLAETTGLEVRTAVAVSGEGRTFVAGSAGRDCSFSRR